MLFQILQCVRDKFVKLLKKRLEDLKAKERVLYINSHWQGKNGEYARDLASLQRRIQSLKKKITLCERNGQP